MIDRKHLKNLLGLVLGLTLSFVTFFFGLWQYDLITSPSVWSNSWTSPVGGLFSQVFEFGRIELFGQTIKFTTTYGVAYDLCQALMVVGLIIGVLSTLLSVWYWE